MLSKDNEVIDSIEFLCYNSIILREEETSMKYSQASAPIICMQTQSTCYRRTYEVKPVGVLWHSTGANNPYISRYVQPSDNAKDREQLLSILGVNKYKNDWNHIERDAGLNAWVGKLTNGDVSSVQSMPWSFRPWGCGSGSRGSCNTGWIQFEICESNLKDSAYFADVYKEACELTAYLCKLYGIDPHGTVTVGGVKVPTILCHRDSYDYHLGSSHSDIRHWFPLHGKSMETVRNDVAALLSGVETAQASPAEPETSSSKYTLIMGKAIATEQQMVAYIRAIAPGVADKVVPLIPLYLEEGAAEGVRGDIAFAQSCLETGNFGFEGSAVTFDQNNFCGMGVTQNGMKGNSFLTQRLGIRAQIQHLKGYATSAGLNQECVDPRYKYVTAGSAIYLEWLGQKENPRGKGWATGKGYGPKILAILNKILEQKPQLKEEEDDMSVTRYNAIQEMPGYAQKTICKMVDKGFIGGTGTGKKDENGRPADLSLSLDMIRIFVTNDRAGLYGD